MKETTPYSIPKEPGRWRAIILAAIVHALLFGFFWIGIRWKNEQPVAVEAEVWDMQAKQAAPRPEPKPEPEIKSEPEPVRPVKPVPAPKVIEEKPDPKAEIVLEQEKKRKAEELKKKREAEEQAKQKKRAEEETKQKRLAEERRAEEEKRKKAEAEQRRIDQEQLKKAQAEKKRKEDEKKRKEAEELARLEKLREENLKRMLGAVGSGGTGEAPKSQGNNRASADYSNRIASKIKSNIAFIVPNDLAGNPPVEFEVRLLPDGSVAGIRKLKSSGVPGFDEAVARAIERSQPYPKDGAGSVPSSFIGTHRPKDQ